MKNKDFFLIKFGEENKKSFTISTLVWLLFFDFLVFILSYFVWPNIHVTQFEIYNYKLDFNPLKTVICFFASVLMMFHLYIKVTRETSFSSKVILLLTFLYFVPGISICGALNFDWDYIASFLAYYFLIVVFDFVIPRPKKGMPLLSENICSICLIFLTAFCLLYPFAMMALYNKSFSFTSFFETLSNPYSARAESKDQNIARSFLLFEHWGVYFGSLLIVNTIRKKNFLMTVLLILIEMFYFSLQGNRIFLFITFLSIVLGFLRLKEKHLSIIFIGMLLIQIIEFYIFGVNNSIGLVTDVFRRYSVVPNLIAPNYYDFFKSEQPDFLRGIFTNIASIFGLSSNYDSNIGYTIGKIYYGININANNGMIGGAFFEFGYVGIILEPLLFILSLRIFDKITFRLNKESVMLVAIIYATLSINTWAVWSQCVRPSYLLLFLISIYFYSGSNLSGHKKRIHLIKTVFR